MKNLSKLLTTSMILGILFLGFQCTKEKSSPPPEAGPQHPIVGQWEWTHSYGPFGDSASPASAELTKTMYFRPDDSLEVFRHYYRGIDTSFTDIYPYEIKNKFNGMDSVPYLFVGNNGAYFAIFHDTILNIDQSVNDGPQEYYRRISAP